MDSDFKLIIDQLINNEESTDEDMASFLSRETSWEYRELFHLIKNVRNDILKMNIPSKTEVLDRILPYLD